MRVQGSVAIQVNAGPLHIAETFLAPAKESQYSPEHVLKLRRQFAEFLRLCYEGVTTLRTYAALAWFYTADAATPFLWLTRRPAWVHPFAPVPRPGSCGATSVACRRSSRKATTCSRPS